MTPSQEGSVQSATAQAPSSLLLIPAAEAVGRSRCSDPAADKERAVNSVLLFLPPCVKQINRAPLFHS